MYALRAGPPLVANLRAYCSGAGSAGASGSGPGGVATAAAAGLALKRYTPQTKTLNLISCGSRRAIASWGTWSVEGRWVWWWKNHIDRAFIARYSGPRGDVVVAPAAAAIPASTGPMVGAPATAAPGSAVTPSAGTR